MSRLLLVVALAACGSGPPPVAPAAPQPDCAGVVAASARFAGAGSGSPDEIERVKGVVALRCVEDHWTAAATSCITAATSLDSAHACLRQHLTVVQHDQLVQRLKADDAVAPKPPAIAEAPPAEIEPEPAPETPAKGQAAIAEKLNAEGTALYKKKSFAGASARFRDAVARVPDSRYFLSLCLSLIAEGKFSEAHTACNAGKTMSPSASTRQKLDAATAKLESEAAAQNVKISE